ncbi:MAG: hypothetical protein O3A92_00915 [Verrucomicrobia bacterium]|nr:hypothetical protein [Verrucomicrobiota bacterium]
MKKFKFPCPNCTEKLSAPLGDGLTRQTCPKCYAPIVIPMPGMTRGPYIAYMLGILLGCAFIVALFRESELQFLVLFGIGMSKLAANVALNWQRCINIGLNGGWGFLGLIPLVSLIGFIFFACEPTGNAASYRERRRALRR